MIHYLLIFLQSVVMNFFTIGGAIVSVLLLIGAMLVLYNHLFEDEISAHEELEEMWI